MKELYEQGLPLREVAAQSGYALRTVKDYLRVMRAKGQVGPAREVEGKPKPEPKVNRRLSPEQRREDVVAQLARIPESEWPVRPRRLAYLLYGDSEASAEAAALISAGVKLGLLEREGRAARPAPALSLAS